MRRWGPKKRRVEEPFHGPVKMRPDLVGQERNLKDPAAQRRALAAILARKHVRKGSSLSKYASLSFQRELTEKECEAVFKIVGWKHGQGS